MRTYGTFGMLESIIVLERYAQQTGQQLVAATKEATTMAAAKQATTVATVTAKEAAAENARYPGGK